MTPELEEFNAWVKSTLRDFSVYTENNIIGKESSIEEEDKMRFWYKVWQLQCAEEEKNEPATYAEKYG
jgi:antibiotic biosynthesis monooxygenase (ABM) superfamily enzyme